MKKNSENLVDQLHIEEKRLLCYNFIEKYLKKSRNLTRLISLKIIEFYFDNAHCKKQIHQFDFTEINLYFNGTKISQSHKYNISRHKDLIILSINRLNITECGLYSIEVMGKNARHIASLNIELTNEKIENAVNQYDFVQSESKWVLKDRVQKATQKETSSIHIATPLMEKYTTTCGKDFKLQINFKSDLQQHTVNWYSNNELIINNSKFEITNSQNTTCLLIKSVDQTDQKEYKVEIKNEKDSVMYKTFLSVQQGTKFLSELKPVEKKSEVIIKPVIVKQLEPLVHGHVGKETKLTCHFKSTKTEKIDWFFNQINLNDKINNQKDKYELKSTNEETSLVIKNINVKDMGDYSCCVYNPSGKCRSVCHLDVVEAPRRITKPFKKQKSDVQNITDSYEKKDNLDLEEEKSSLLKEPEQKSSSIQEIKAEEVVEKEISLKSDDSSEAETVILADSTLDELKIEDETQVQKYALNIKESEIQPNLISEKGEKSNAENKFSRNMIKKKN
ncbi:titin isoform X16 [Brachionus plicatilis]|uniref:Titin isoform X16 n=1 Tax=Brachionus plicatilis TaxID=10195 RepID=A0A3M7RER4_BRAPC|nr:titin isoform X16 [Brachionus plicatilis]